MLRYICLLNSYKLLYQLLILIQLNLKQLVTNLQVIGIYNNINFKDTKYNKVISYKVSIYTIITTTIIHCPKLLLLGLQQSMYNLLIKLSIIDIFKVPTISRDNNSIRVAIIRSLILNIVKRVYMSSVNKVFRGSNLYP